MAVFKCKMCGGTLEIIQGETVAVCEYCNTKQTVPVADDEKKMSLFTRANKLRFACDFDKAAGIYESIIAEYSEEAESYWGLILCKYGIEYVDDPATGKKIPTCHRSSFDSVMDDENFELVMENADSVSRSVYREEAKKIEELRKGIIEVSSKEEPYDIFICYKETAENGDRTIDSVIAQDVYDELTAKGYRVFFSRITLEDKLGQEYEPYIFAALNSAKVMLAFGTDYEYYNAVWVKNEWSRFLQLIAKGEKKTLIPCYKNIDAYDMPKEFAKLQAQDMGKVGAIQDLLRGIEKIIPKNEPVEVKETVVINQSGPNVEALLKRGNNALEDGNFSEAKTHFDKALDIDAECAEAYLGLTMVDKSAATKRDLVFKDFSDNKNYARAKQYADKNFLDELTVLETEAVKNTEEKRKYVAEVRAKTEKFKSLITADDTFAYGLKSDGTLVGIPLHVFANSDVPDWFDIVAISCGHFHMVGLKSDGTVVSTKCKIDSANHGQCNVSDWTDIVAISSGTWHTVGLKSNGTVVSTIEEKAFSKEKCNVSDWTNIVSISAGMSHTVGLKSDGTVIAVGENDFGQCAVSQWTDIVALSTGSSHTVGLKSDGTVVAVGNNAQGQCDVSDWCDIVAVSSDDSCTVGLMSNGKVVVVGEIVTDVSDWTDIIAVSVGGRHAVGLKRDGTLFSGRANSKKLFDDFENYEEARKIKTDIAFINDRNHTTKTNELYDIAVSKKNTTTTEAAEEERIRKEKVSEEARIRLAPIREKISKVTNIVAVGFYHTVGLKSDGTVLTVGYNENGECDALEWENIVAVAAEGYHTVGLKADGTVVAVGDNEEGQCNVSEWKNIVAVAAGEAHIVGLKSDGTVVTVGGNKYGQCNVSEWENIVAVAAGNASTIGLNSDGSVVAVGNNEDEQCDVDDWENIVAVAAGNFHTVGLKSDGTVVAVGENEDEQCDVDDWRLFDNIEKLEEERISEECLAEETRISEEKRRVEEQKAAYRVQGLCQYCGGTFKGLFTKKCSNCGKAKDY